MDAWLDEDEEVIGLRDPYHRVDARRSSRRIEVRAGGEVVARSDRPVVVAETGLPLRMYLPREDVLADAGAQRHDRGCPYKGRAALLVAGRRRGRRPGPTSEPLESMLKARGHVCFDDAKVEVVATVEG